jgi:hypothetical protein
MNCPFQVGDRIHELAPVLSYQDEVVPTDLLDPTKPDATVTEITEYGFAYRYDFRIPIGRAEWGTWTEGGECYSEGFPYWRKI